MISLVFLVAIAVLDSVTANKDHNNLCRDLTDFGDLTYINETVQVCTSTLEKKCDPITVKECLDVTEMLRILRPGGHLLWTMKTVDDEKTAEFKSFDANLNGLGRAGRIKVGCLSLLRQC